MPRDLKIIIPAAGIGKRLQPHTLIRPKPLLPVAGKPMLAHILDPLVMLEPAEFVFVIGHLGNQIVDYVGTNYRFKANFVEQKELLGLGYAINVALEKITPGPLLIILSDTIARVDFSKFVSLGENVIGLKEVEDSRRFGIATIIENKIVSFEEKPLQPKSRMAIIGLYYFSDSDILKYHIQKIIKLDRRTCGEIQLTDALDSMARDNNIFRPYVVEDWFDCGKMETMIETNRLLLMRQNFNGKIAGSKIIPPVAIAASAVIKNSTIGPYATISNSAKIFDSSISDSIVFDKAVVEGSDLNASLVGEGAKVRDRHGSFNIGQLTEIANN